MANSSIDLSLSVEAVLHRTLHTLFEEYAKRYGVTVDRVEVDWLRGTNTDLVCKLCVHTSSDMTLMADKP